MFYIRQNCRVQYMHFCVGNFFIDVVLCKSSLRKMFWQRNLHAQTYTLSEIALLNLEWLIFNRATQPHDGELGQFEQYFYLYNCASLQKGCLTTTCKAYPVFKETKTPLCSNLTIKIQFSNPCFLNLFLHLQFMEIVPAKKGRVLSSECHYIPAKADATYQQEDDFFFLFQSAINH